ncbi:MAG: hypothetical protein HYY29_00385, partial [Chloroflexi bacterium]|nr:hypothetical protein [Chloroflexota bacterium]
MNIQKPFWHKSIRLKEYDYTQAGSYFITICSHDNRCLFGSVSDEQMHVNAFGEIVAREWAMTGNIRPNVTIDEFIVMPNHIHAIIGLAD